jgi:protein arginine N-methyltransferase 7
MQAIYFPSSFISLSPGEQFYLKCNHDEYSLWFNIFAKADVEQDHKKCLSMQQPFEYSLVSRNRLAQINDKTRNKNFFELLKTVPNPVFRLLNFGKVSNPVNT